MRKSVVIVAVWGAVAAAVSIGWALSPNSSGAGASGAALEGGPAGEPEVEVAIADDVPRATSDHKAANQGSCRGGCSLAHHDIPDLTVGEFRQARDAYAEKPADQESQALDTLLFYGARTRELLEQEGNGPLPQDHIAFLKRELGRENALVWLRLINDAGEVRVALGPTRVPLGVKKHLEPPVRVDVQPLEFSGTVMRTGLYHLWSRY